MELLGRASCLVLLLTACGQGEAGRTPPVHQWVFSQHDALQASALSATRHDFGTATWIGSLVRRGSGVGSQLGVAPTRDDSASTWVIRLEDDITPLVDSLPIATFEARVCERVAALLATVERDGRKHTVQLDYDVPVRLLERWAHLVRVLRSGPLQGRSVWVTSILAHLEHPRYGQWFRNVADGHILQLFDSGLPHTRANERRVEVAVRSVRLPTALGLGAFERMKRGRSTDHRAWFTWAARSAVRLNLRSIWIFPGGAPYQHLLSSVGL